jgi:[protein-PII] uridylyltransferase
VSEDFTVIDVSTRDRIGILFAIANTLFHLDLRIHLAKITTTVDRVLDGFYVSDAAGRKIEKMATLQHIVAELLAALKPIAEPERPAAP